MLRSYRVNFRRNWVVQPSRWNLFFSNLEADMSDLYDEVVAQEFDTNLDTTTDEVVQNIGRFDVHYPKL